MATKVISLFSIIGAAVLLFSTVRSLGNALPKQDFAQYWSASRLVGQNPYSRELTYDFEQREGLHAPINTLVIPNPPWVLVFTLPLRFFRYSTAFALWTLLTLAAVTVCSRVLWRVFTPAPSLQPAFISLLFGPTLVTLMLGQFAVLGLVGATACIYCLHHHRHWLAGISLLLLLIKPHLVIPFLLILTLWAVSSKQWQLISGGILAFALANGIVLLLNPHIFQQYLAYSSRFTTERVPYPNLGGILYLTTRLHPLALLPLCASALWSIYYWRTHRRELNIAALSPFLLLIGIVCAYYSFSYDELLGLPALLYVAATGNKRIFWVGFVVIEIGYVLYFANCGSVTGLDYMFLCWISLAILFTYLLGRQNPETRPPSLVNTT